MIVFFRMRGTFKTGVRKVSSRFTVSVSQIFIVKTFYFQNCIFIHPGMRLRHEDSVRVTVREPLFSRAAYVLPLCMIYIKVVYELYGKRKTVRALRSRTV